MDGVELYSPALKDEWDRFVDGARNATFLFRRDYMDYHADRFTDHSLVFRDKTGKIEALLPASVHGSTLKSHGGLTYGGFIVDNHATATALIALTRRLVDHATSQGFTEIIYKAVPHIYHRFPSEEDLYALFRFDATVSSTLISSVIDLTGQLPFNENARRAVKHAMSRGVSVGESDDFAAFWDILSRLLAEKYDCSPVHSLQEILSLRERFPENIRLFTATVDGEIIAGTVIYFTDTVAHAQYIATSPRGRELKALPLLFRHVIDNHCATVRYFDFGTSNEDNGRYLNEGLLRQKTGMGARGVVYTTYRVALSPIQ